MSSFLHRVWQDEEGQDIAEYAVMLAVILVIVVGTVRLIGSNANNVFSYCCQFDKQLNSDVRSYVDTASGDA